MLVGAVRGAKRCRDLVCGRSREVHMPASGQLEFFANDVPEISTGTTGAAYSWR